MADQIEVDMIVKAISQGFDNVSKDLGKAGKATESAGKAAQNTGLKFTELKSILDITTRAARTAGEVMKQAFEFGEQGAEISQMGQSFNILIDKVGASSDLLDELKEASRGTVDEMKLMGSTSLLLAGTSGELATELANATPQLLGIAKAAQKLNPSLGDTTFLYDSLARGVKRASPLILDNLGLMISVGDANEMYAKSVGKSVDQLDMQEQKLALLQAVLAQGDQMIQQAGGSTASLTDSFGQLRATITNLTNDFKARMYPEVEKVVSKILELYDATSQASPALSNQARRIIENADSAQEARDSIIQLVEAQGLFISESGDLVSHLVRHGEVIENVIESNFLYALGITSSAEADAIMKERLDRKNQSLEDSIDIQEEVNEQHQVSAERQEELKNAIEEAEQAIRDQIVANLDLAESFTGASDLDLFEQAIADLKDRIEEAGDPTGYLTGLIMNLQDASGLATEDSRALAENWGLFMDAVETGLIPLEDADEALRAFRQDALDGAVDFEELLEKFGMFGEITPEVIDAFDEHKEALENFGIDTGMALETLGTTVEEKDWSTVGNNAGSKMVSGFKGQYGVLATETNKTVEGIKTEFTAVDWIGIGHGIGAGVAKGIESSIPLAVAAARELAKQTAAVMEGYNEQESPSKRYARIGKYAAQGYAKGFVDNAWLPARAAESMASLTNNRTQNTTNYSSRELNIGTVIEGVGKLSSFWEEAQMLDV